MAFLPQGSCSLFTVFFSNPPSWLVTKFWIYKILKSTKDYKFFSPGPGIPLSTPSLQYEEKFFSLQDKGCQLNYRQTKLNREEYYRMPCVYSPVYKHYIAPEPLACPPCRLTLLLSSSLVIIPPTHITNLTPPQECRAGLHALHM